MRWRPRGSDVLVAAGCLVAALALLVALPVLDPSAATGSVSWRVTAGAVLVQAAALVWSSRLPRAVPLAVAAVPVVLVILAPGAEATATTIAVLAAAYLAGTLLHRPAVGMVVAGMLVLVTVSTALTLVRTGQASTAAALPIAFAQALLVVGIPVLVAAVVVGRRDTRAAHEAQIAALEREQQARVAAAVAASRTAVARDLHDIAAHHLSGIAMLAAALERQIETDPARARTAAHDIRTQSTAILADLRRAVGLLRDGDGEPTADRSLASLGTLVREWPKATLATSGDHAGLGELAQLVGYRMVQESLANVALHAPGAACEVRLEGAAAGAVVLTVRNEPPARAVETGRRDGYGLVGMAERADLVGGSLQYGPTPEGGWDVTLTLPREGRSA